MQIQLSDHFTYRKLIRFVLPTSAMMIFTSIYGVVDGLFVSNFIGKTPFAAINLIMPFIMILGGMGFMVGTGGTALVTKILGQGDEKRANRTFSLCILFTVLLGTVLTAVGVTCTRPIARLLGASPAMMDDCVLYGRIVIAFTVPFMLQSVFQSFLAAAEKPKLGFLVTVAAGCTNAALDALFIVGFHWGLTGAALATGIGQCVGGLLPIFYFRKKRETCHLYLCRPSREFRQLLAICANGSSELMNNISASLVSMLYNLVLMAKIGEDGVSAYGVLMYVQFIFVALEVGYSVGAAPIVGYHFGAENRDELKNILRKSLLLMSIAGICLAGLAEVLAVPLAHLFVGYDATLYALTVHAFHIFSFSFLFAGINIYMSGFFTALNNGGVSALIAFLRTLVFQSASVLLLPLLFGVDGIWWAIAAAEIFALAVSLTALLLNRKKYGYF